MCFEDNKARQYARVKYTVTANAASTIDKLMRLHNMAPVLMANNLGYDTENMIWHNIRFALYTSITRPVITGVSAHDV